MENEKKIGLALSGGGYRATAFHLGTLKKLHELGILQKVDVISSISGGSILAAAYCLDDAAISKSPKDFENFANQMSATLNTKGIIKEVILSWTFARTIALIILFLLCSYFLSFVFTIILLVLFYFFQFKIFPIEKVIEKAYDKIFYGKKTLNDFKEITIENQKQPKPRLVIGSTNLDSGRPFTFSKDKMGDTYYDIKFNPEKFPVSRAVVASTCVPFAFSPVIIGKEFFKNPDDFDKIFPRLVDGGVYDNQGIHKITDEKSSYLCDIIITSDAGNKLPFRKTYTNTISLLIRSMDVFMNRIKNFQMIQNIYRNVGSKDKEIAYFSLGWHIEYCIDGFIKNLAAENIIEEVIKAHNIPQNWVENPAKFEKEIKELLEKNVNYAKILANNLNNNQLEIAQNVGTNLTKLSENQIKYLIQHAENMAELQVRLYCPSLIKQ